MWPTLSTIAYLFAVKIPHSLCVCPAFIDWYSQLIFHLEETISTASTLSQIGEEEKFTLFASLH